MMYFSFRLNSQILLIVLGVNFKEVTTYKFSTMNKVYTRLYVLLSCTAVLSLAVSKNVTDQNENDKSIDPVLGPVLILIFSSLLIFVVVTFYIGIRKHLESLKCVEERSKANEGNFKTSQPLKCGLKTEENDCCYSNEAYVADETEQIQPNLVSDIKENKLVGQNEEVSGKKSEICTISSKVVLTGYTQTSF